jgi:hypothetical protein
MTEQTYSRRLAQLIKDVKDHPNCDEILRLAMEQLADDNYEVQQP